ncbi:hypothetical protein EK21DRAFT_84988 [Setomelanomma holmii]|uniref:C2H2-type domain-containing protein n=1 Tax=Setomelanomma holmii TaxID=210430 RepID=A0A9P4HJU3_9PLEO|nr:hypothetical protein EK21DRAFT_84988 [Setomelanomma holmii]
MLYVDDYAFSYKNNIDDMSSEGFQTTPDDNDPQSSENGFDTVLQNAEGEYTFVENGGNLGHRVSDSGNWAQHNSFRPDTTAVGQGQYPGHVPHMSQPVQPQAQVYSQHISSNAFRGSDAVGANDMLTSDTGDVLPPVDEHPSNTRRLADTQAWQTQRRNGSPDSIRPELLFPSDNWAFGNNSPQLHGSVQGEGLVFDDDTFGLGEAAQNPERYLRQSFAEFGRPGAHNTLSMPLPQPASHDGRAPFMPTSNLSELGNMKQVDGGCSEPWYMLAAAQPQSEGRMDDESGIQHFGFETISSSDNTIDRVSYALSQEEKSGTSDTSWQIPEVMVNSQMTITDRPRLPRRRPVSPYVMSVSENHSMTNADAALNEGAYVGFSRVNDTDRSVAHSYHVRRITNKPRLSDSYLHVPGRGQRVSRCPSPVPSVTSVGQPDVFMCPEEDCHATFTGAYRRGNQGRHMRLKHGRKERVYPCEDLRCDKIFLRQDARLKHYRKKHSHLAPGSPQPRANNRRTPSASMT